MKLSIQQLSILLLFIVICLLNRASFAQTLHFKLYSNLDYVKNDIRTSNYDDFGFVSGSQESDYHLRYRLTPAIALTTKKSFHELTISQFKNEADKIEQVNPYINGAHYTNGLTTTNFSSFALMYEFGKVVSSSSAKAPKLITVGINPYRTKIESKPLADRAFLREETGYGGMLSVSLKMNYLISSKLLVDISLPVNLLNFVYTKQQIHNPNIPISQQITETFEFDFVPAIFNIKIGLGYVHSLD